MEPSRLLPAPSPQAGTSAAGGAALPPGAVEVTREGVVLDPSLVEDRRTEAEKKAEVGGWVGGGALCWGGGASAGLGQGSRRQRTWRSARQRPASHHRPLCACGCGCAPADSRCRHQQPLPPHGLQARFPLVHLWMQLCPVPTAAASANTRCPSCCPHVLPPGPLPQVPGCARPQGRRQEPPRANQGPQRQAGHADGCASLICFIVSAAVFVLGGRGSARWVVLDGAKRHDVGGGGVVLGVCGVVCVCVWGGGGGGGGGGGDTGWQCVWCFCSACAAAPAWSCGPQLHVLMMLLGLHAGVL